jgi:hypothetical protein
MPVLLLLFSGIMRLVMPVSVVRGFAPASRIHSFRNLAGGETSGIRGKDL